MHLSLLVSSLMVLPFICGACIGGSQAGRAPTPEDSSAEFPYVLGGKRDSGNVYPSTVLITAPAGDQRVGNCSGVIISPRRVLTAAHCVCLEQAAPLPTGELGTVIDGSVCLGEVAVQAMLYGTPGYPKDFRGIKIEPHPELELLYDSDGGLVFAASDLAVIHLEKEIQGIRSVELSKTALRAGSRIVFVGFGYADLEQKLFGERYFGRTELSQVEGELLKITRPGAHANEGDSGGPCLQWHRGKKAPLLVGISRGGRAPLYSVFTSTVFPRNREWLERIIREDAQGVGASSP